MLLEELVAFVEHPVKAFLRQRLGVSLATYDDLPVDGLALELDGLEAWGVTDRMLRALLAGGDIDAVEEAERARGLLPPGALGGGVLAASRAKAGAIAQASEVAAGADRTSHRTSLEIDVALGDGRRVIGVVPDVVGTTIACTTASSIKAKHRIAAWARLVAATAAHPELALRSVTVGGARGDPRTVTFSTLGTTRDERAAVALAHLTDLVALRDEGMRRPLPLPVDAGRRYAEVIGAGNAPDEAQVEAGKYWTSSFDWDKEDRDPEHVLAFGGELTIEQLAELGFGQLATRLWMPVLRAERTARR